MHDFKCAICVFICMMKVKVIVCETLFPNACFNQLQIHQLVVNSIVSFGNCEHKRFMHYISLNKERPLVALIEQYLRLWPTAVVLKVWCEQITSSFTGEVSSPHWTTSTLYASINVTDCIRVITLMLSHKCYLNLTQQCLHSHVAEIWCLIPEHVGNNVAKGDSCVQMCTLYRFDSSDVQVVFTQRHGSNV